MKNIVLFLVFSLVSVVAVAHKARVKGVILDENNNPVENVSISAEDLGTVTNSNGFYQLEIPANKNVTLVF